MEQQRGWEKLITWADIAKGVGEVVMHTLFDQFHHEPATHGDHFIKDSLASPIEPVTEL